MTGRLGFGALCALILYFAFSAFAGEQGLGRWREMQQTTSKLEATLAELEAHRDRLQARVDGLDPDNPDPDLVAAIAREKLGFLYPDEVTLRID